MQGSIYLRSSLALPSSKISSFSNTSNLFPATKTSSSSAAISKLKAVLRDNSLAISTIHREDDVATVRLDSMIRANTALEDFCRSYFMFHETDIDSAESLFKHIPFLSFTESYIYQVDNLNETLMQLPSGGTTANLTLGKLAVLLEGYGLLTDRIRNELNTGEEYWALERKLCGALIRKEEIKLEEVARANYLRSTDYRVLNLLMYQLNGKEVNEKHMEFLSASTFLTEICVDFLDYEDDVIRNTYNMLRMFVGIYGPSSGPTMFAKLIKEAQEKYNYLLSTLDPHLALKYEKRREDVAKQVGKAFSFRLENWSIPRVIEDEESYRCENSNAKCWR